MKLPLIIDHRGCKYPGIRENSCKSVENSIKEGVDIVELDVVCAKDNNFIGYHPKLFQRKPLSTASNVDLFESLLKTLDSRAMLYTDIKENLTPGKMDALSGLIKKYHYKQVIIGSYYLPVLRYFRQLQPTWIINYHCLATRRSIQRAINVGANWINPIPYWVARRFVAEATRKGLKFVPGGNENYQKQLRYAKFGAYALSVFKPAFFREWLKSRHV